MQEKEKWKSYRKRFPVSPKKIEDREKGVRTGYNKYQIITFGGMR